MSMPATKPRGDSSKNINSHTNQPLLTGQFCAPSMNQLPNCYLSTIPPVGVTSNSCQQGVTDPASWWRYTYPQTIQHPATVMSLRSNQSAGNYANPTDVLSARTNRSSNYCNANNNQYQNSSASQPSTVILIQNSAQQRQQRILPKVLPQGQSIPVQGKELPQRKEQINPRSPWENEYMAVAQRIQHQWHSDAGSKTTATQEQDPRFSNTTQIQELRADIMKQHMQQPRQNNPSSVLQAMLSQDGKPHSNYQFRNQKSDNSNALPVENDLIQGVSLAQENTGTSNEGSDARQKQLSQQLMSQQLATGCQSQTQQQSTELPDETDKQIQLLLKQQQQQQLLLQLLLSGRQPQQQNASLINQLLGSMGGSTGNQSPMTSGLTNDDRDLQQPGTVQSVLGAAVLKHLLGGSSQPGAAPSTSNAGNLTIGGVASIDGLSRTGQYSSNPANLTPPASSGAALGVTTVEIKQLQLLQLIKELQQVEQEQRLDVLPDTDVTSRFVEQLLVRLRLPLTVSMPVSDGARGRNDLIDRRSSSPRAGSNRGRALRLKSNQTCSAECIQLSRDGSVGGFGDSGGSQGRTRPSNVVGHPGESLESEQMVVEIKSEPQEELDNTMPQLEAMHESRSSTDSANAQKEGSAKRGGRSSARRGGISSSAGRNRSASDERVTLGEKSDKSQGKGKGSTGDTGNSVCQEKVSLLSDATVLWRRPDGQKSANLGGGDEAKKGKGDVGRKGYKESPGVATDKTNLLNNNIASKQCSVVLCAVDAQLSNINKSKTGIKCVIAADPKGKVRIGPKSRLAKGEANSVTSVMPVLKMLRSDSDKSSPSSASSIDNVGKKAPRAAAIVAAVNRKRVLNQSTEDKNEEEEESAASLQTKKKTREHGSGRGRHNKKLLKFSVLKRNNLGPQSSKTAVANDSKFWKDLVSDKDKSVDKDSVKNKGKSAVPLVEQSKQIIATPLTQSLSPTVSEMSKDVKPDLELLNAALRTTELDTTGSKTSSFMSVANSNSEINLSKSSSLASNGLCKVAGAMATCRVELSQLNASMLRQVASSESGSNLRRGYSDDEDNYSDNAGNDSDAIEDEPMGESNAESNQQPSIASSNQSTTTTNDQLNCSTQSNNSEVTVKQEIDLENTEPEFGWVNTASSLALENGRRESASTTLKSFESAVESSAVSSNSEETSEQGKGIDKENEAVKSAGPLTIMEQSSATKSRSEGEIAANRESNRSGEPKSYLVDLLMQLNENIRRSVKGGEKVNETDIVKSSSACELNQTGSASIEDPVMSLTLTNKDTEGIVNPTNGQIDIMDPSSTVADRLLSVMDMEQEGVKEELVSEVEGMSAMAVELTGSDIQSGNRTNDLSNKANDSGNKTNTFGDKVIDITVEANNSRAKAAESMGLAISSADQAHKTSKNVKNSSNEANNSAEMTKESMHKPVEDDDEVVILKCTVKAKKSKVTEESTAGTTTEMPGVVTVKEEPDEHSAGRIKRYRNKHWSQIILNESAHYLAGHFNEGEEENVVEQYGRSLRKRKARVIYCESENSDIEDDNQVSSSGRRRQKHVDEADLSDKDENYDVSKDLDAGNSSDDDVIAVNSELEPVVIIDDNDNADSTNSNMVNQLMSQPRGNISDMTNIAQQRSQQVMQFMGQNVNSAMSNISANAQPTYILINPQITLAVGNSNNGNNYARIMPNAQASSSTFNASTALRTLTTHNVISQTRSTTAGNTVSSSSSMVTTCGSNVASTSGNSVATTSGNNIVRYSGNNVTNPVNSGSVKPLFMFSPGTRGRPRKDLSAHQANTVDKEEEFQRKISPDKLPPAVAPDITLVPSVNTSTTPNHRYMYVSKAMLDGRFEWMTLVTYISDNVECQCVFCPIRKSTTPEVIAHIASTHMDYIFALSAITSAPNAPLYFRCRYCQYVAIQPHIMIVHFAVHHGVKGIISTTVPKVTKSVPVGRSLEDTFQGSTAYACYDCEYVTEEQNHLLQHVAASHPTSSNHNGFHVRLKQLIKPDDKKKPIEASMNTYRNALLAMTKTHVREMFVCCQCNNGAYCEYRSLVHSLAKHVPIQMLMVCNRCEYNSVTPSEMDSHIRLLHTNRESEKQCSVTLVDEKICGGKKAYEELSITINCESAFNETDKNKQAEKAKTSTKIEEVAKTAKKAEEATKPSSKPQEVIEGRSSFGRQIRRTPAAIAAAEEAAAEEATTSSGPKKSGRKSSDESLASSSDSSKNAEAEQDAEDGDVEGDDSNSDTSVSSDET